MGLLSMFKLHSHAYNAWHAVYENDYDAAINFLKKVKKPDENERKWVGQILTKAVNEEKVDFLGQALYAIPLNEYSKELTTAAVSKPKILQTLVDMNCADNSRISEAVEQRNWESADILKKIGGKPTVDSITTAVKAAVFDANIDDVKKSLSHGNNIVPVFEGLMASLKSGNSSLITMFSEKIKYKQEHLEQPYHSKGEIKLPIIAQVAQMGTMPSATTDFFGSYVDYLETLPKESKELTVKMLENCATANNNTQALEMLNSIMLKPVQVTVQPGKSPIFSH